MPTYKNISSVNQSYEDIKGNHKIAAPNETIATFQLLDWLYGSDKWQKIDDEPRYYPLLGFDYHSFSSSDVTDEWVSNVPKSSKLALIIGRQNGNLKLKINNAPSYKSKEGDYDIIIPSSSTNIWSNPVVILTDGKVQTIHLYKYYQSCSGMVFIYYLDKIELNGWLPWGIAMQDLQLINIGKND